MRKLCLVVVLVTTSLLAQNTAQPKAIIDTTAGKINCTLFPDKAPKSVANFIGLATGTKDWTNPTTGAKMHGVPLYNGTIFHRVIPGFMIQGGDPAGSGAGDVGFGFGLEVTPDLKYDRAGRLAYARTNDPNTNAAQFFITVAPASFLDMKYTIFGQCEDLDVVRQIVNAPRDANDRPRNPTVIRTITIVQPGAASPKPATK
jgi:peptidyl-prolyl cis-trans isomerase A (cyclophilin A)